MGCLSCVNLESPGLYEPYTPCQLDSGDKCSECMQGMELKSLILKAQTALDLLLERHRRLRTRINKRHDPIILRLSPEISSSIFQFCIRSEALEVEIKRCSFKAIVSGPLTLGAVCRDWRRIAFSTPQLWTFVLVRLSPLNNSWHVNFLRDWLSRSGGLALTIHAYHLRLNNFFARRQTQRDIPNEHDLQLIDLMNQHSSRWYNVNLDLFPPLLSLFKGNHSKVCILDSLTLHPARPGAQFRLSDSCPTPTSIDLSLLRLNNVVIGWWRVTHATVKDLQLDEWLELLRRAPNLIECTVGPILQVSEEYHPLPSQPIIHERLQTLNLQRSDMMTAFIDLVNFPALRKLHLHLRELPLEALFSMFRRSSCKLRTLRLTSDGLTNEEAILPLLREISSLVRLDIRVMDLNREFPVVFLDLLAKTSMLAEGESDFLPNLQFLTYYPGNRFPWHLLAPVFGPLSELSNPRRRPLESVHIYFLETDDRFLHLLEPEDREEFADPVIDEESIPSLLAVSRAGLDLQIGYPEGSINLIDVSMAKHRMNELESP